MVVVVPAVAWLTPPLGHEIHHFPELQSKGGVFARFGAPETPPLFLRARLGGALLSPLFGALLLENLMLLADFAILA